MFRFFDNLDSRYSKENIDCLELSLINQAKFNLAKAVFFSENAETTKSPEEGHKGRYAHCGKFHKIGSDAYGSSTYVGENSVYTTEYISVFEREFRPNMDDPIFNEWDSHPDVVAIKSYFEMFRSNSYEYSLYQKAIEIVENPEYKWGSQLKDLWNSLGYSRDEKGIGLNELMPITVSHGHLSVTISKIRETQVACRWWVTIDNKEFDLKDEEFLTCLIRKWAEQQLAEREEDVWL